MTTGAPRRTWLNSQSASGMYMRMQPCEAEYPTDAASGVPWIPTPGADVPIQRVPSGLPGPGGIGFRPRAQSEFGGRHQGFRCMSTMWKIPVGVGYCARPVATGNPRTCLVELQRSRRFDPVRITITGPKLARCTVGF